MTAPENDYVVSGTATWDRVRGKAGLREAFDGKAVCDFFYRQAGGGAVNARLALEAIAAAYGEKARVTICTKLGKTSPENEAKDLVLKDLHNEGMHDDTIIDMAFDKEYIVPDNAISIFGGNGTVNRFIWKIADDSDTLFSEDIEKQIVAKAAKAKINILNSRFPTQVMVAAQAAKDNGVPVLLDYSETNAEKEGMGDIIGIADYMTLPSDAAVPGMPMSLKERIKNRVDEALEKLKAPVPAKTDEKIPNPDDEPKTRPSFWANNIITSSLLYAFQSYARKEEPDRAARLAKHLHYKFGKSYVAVSNGSKPVEVCINGQFFKLSVENIPYFPEYDENGTPKKKLLDNLGAGDVRDAAMGFFISRGEDFGTALGKASRIASFSTQYPGRTWIAHLDEFLRADPVLKRDFPNENLLMPGTATA
ncbi:MAG: hypothetical protein ACT4OY_08235 [Alphaproteobacteria bacterium]